MGDVWRGVHEPTGLPVALKTLSADRLRTDAHREAFAREVRAVAALHHPAVVRLFDHGVVTPDAEDASGGRLPAGSSWLAMELAHGGTLKQVLPTTWPDVRGALATVLAALAHAHARGVIHRDLKASNVLVAAKGDLRPGLLLADFGAAHRIDGDRDPDDIAARIGTPHAMAPEQIVGEDHAIGPATDLYALGCLGWWLATGRRVFKARRAEDMLLAQLHQAPGVFETMVPVPAGFEPWLRRLLCKHPEDRFAVAADAHRALLALGEPGSATGPALRSTPSWPFDSDLTVPVGRILAEVGVATLPPEPLAVDRAPVPDDWRRARPVRVPTLHGAGLGLFGLRRLPLVGRTELQDALWEELRSVANEGSPRIVLLRGQAGAGKSGLARWLTERAAELGAAESLWTSFDATAPAEQGFGALVRRALRSRAAVEAVASAADERLHAQGVEDVAEWKAVLALGMPGYEAGAPPSEEARFAALTRFIAREARRRAAVVWLDDVHAARGARAWLRWLRRHAPADFPVLVVATVRDDLLDAGGARDVEALAPDAQWTVEPLAAAATRSLVSDLLHLSGELAEEVAERSAGTPLFAVQLVGDWVARGALRPVPGGFALAEGADARLPDSIDALFQSALDSALAGSGDGPRRWLQIAATLGNPVATAEVVAACRHHGAPFRRGPFDRLVRRGLLLRTDDGWAFTHGLLAESIQQGLPDDVRRRLHRDCAHALQALGDQGGVVPSARIGRHLLAAGEPEAALQPLLDAVDRRYLTSAYEEALELLDGREEAVATLGLAPHDRRTLLGVLARAAILRETPRFAEARAIIDALRPMLEENGEPDLMARALLTRARAQASALDVAGSHATLQELEPIRGALATASERFAERLLVGFLAQRSNQPDVSERIYADARAEAVELQEWFFVAQFDVQSSGIALKHRTAEEALELGMRAHTISLEHGHPRGAASGQMAMANALRKQEKWDAAIEAYRGAIALYTAAGSAGGDIARNNLGGMLLEREQWSDARVIARETRRSFRAAGRRPWEAMAVTMQALCDAGERRWSDLGGRLAEAAELLEPCSSAQSGSAQIAEKAADHAEEAGQTDLAIVALELAVMHWERLSRGVDTERVTRRIRGLRALAGPSGDPPTAG